MCALRIVFMGTPELAGFSLEALLRDSKFQVVAVVTQPDRPKGRELRLQPSPVKTIALRAGLPVLQPERARAEDFIGQLRDLRPELIAVAAYGHILPESILLLPTLGCVNVHTSLLPKYRGAAPIQWALLNGEAETGVTIMRMDAGMDTGAVLAQEKTAILPTDDAQALHQRLGQMGAALLARTLPEYAAGRVQPVPQPAAGVSYAPKIRKQDGEIDWRQPALAIWNRIRAFTPWPGAFTHLPDQPQPPHLLKIWQAEVVNETGAPGQTLRVGKSGLVVACGRDALRLLTLQREGGRRMTAQEFLTGHPLEPGQRLS